MNMSLSKLLSYFILLMTSAAFLFRILHLKFSVRKRRWPTNSSRILPEFWSDLDQNVDQKSSWFSIISDGPLPSVLQEVSLPIITNEQCEEMFRFAGHYELIPKIFICAGYKMGKKDACDVSIL